MRIHSLIAITVCAGAVALVGVAHADKISVDSLPPSVVKTVPICGDAQVDPKTAEVKVTFSKEMMTEQMWSWCMQSPDTFPEISDKGGVRYLQDKRTCVLPVALKPNRTYVIWINTQQHNAFRDQQGHPAVPYLLVFKTK